MFLLETLAEARGNSDMTRSCWTSLNVKQMLGKAKKIPLPHPIHRGLPRAFVGFRAPQLLRKAGHPIWKLLVFILGSLTSQELHPKQQKTESQSGLHLFDVHRKAVEKRTPLLESEKERERETDAVSLWEAMIFLYFSVASRSTKP